MTISSNLRKAGPFAGNAATTAFPFAYKVFTASDVVVTKSDGVTETTLVLTTDYTVALNPDQNANPGGTVTYPASGSPLPVGQTLTLSSFVPELQQTSITTQGGFYPKIIEDALDRLTIFVQQIKEQLNRSLRLPISVTGVSTQLPIPIGSQVIAWKPDGSGLQNVGPVDNTLLAVQLVDSADAAKGATLIGYLGGTLRTYLNQFITTAGASIIGWIQSGTGAVFRLVRDKLRERVTIEDFGGVGDGATDDYAAIATFLAYVTTNHCVGEISGKTWRHTQPIGVPLANNYALRGAGSGVSIFLYDGASTTPDIFTIGDGVTSVKNVRLSGFTVRSNVTMTAGTGIRLRKFCRSTVNDVTPDGQDGNGKLWHGIWFNELDFVSYDHFEILAQKDGMRINGGISGPKADLFLDHYKIAGCDVGIRVGGAFGGMFFGNGDIINNGDNVVIDNTLAAEVNREIIFDPSTTLDTASRCGLVIDQALASNMWVSIPSHTWIASCASHGIWIKNANGAKIAIDAYIFNITGDGIRCDDAGTFLEIGNPIFNAITGYGINPTVAMSNLRIDCPRFEATPNTFNFTSNRVSSNQSFPISIQSGRAIAWDTFTGTLDGSGNASITHGKGVTYYQKVISVFASAKTSGGAWNPLTTAFVDGTSISVTGSAPLASRPYNVMVMVGDVANTGW